MARACLALARPEYKLPLPGRVTALHWQLPNDHTVSPCEILCSNYVSTSFTNKYQSLFSFLISCHDCLR